MEANKIKGPAKCVTLPNGDVITYAERGEQNKEIMFTGALYHHTFMPVVEELAKRFHVYAFIMRTHGVVEEINTDGSIHWANQWGKDLYDFANYLGIKKFHYLGKCHGTMPGWWLIKNHPEMLYDFCSFFLGPHTLPQNSNVWMEASQNGKMQELLKMSIRNIESGLKKKQEELKCLGPNLEDTKALMKYMGFPEILWDNDIETMEYALKTTNVPIGYLFGSEDPLFNDFYDSNMKLPFITKKCHFTILQGERHLMELDCPDRIADEAFFFISQAHKNYA
ncbi:alpha/beta-hydrolase [Anaeromyces robustus]|uniref:Alpha/beta-hydrolase n=1 Tax=Anaeromyces robustus TaxID=1754192 RepID=A0A1Y1XL60_9FUNG|nr:alpha/beta-hydrolase [Anaeromyces robustus]|eukprot:ORX86498.1 alpha/beta-hydrolase [Anaeromyces robustus]